jgi:hypothetical protein
MDIDAELPVKVLRDSGRGPSCRVFSLLGRVRLEKLSLSRSVSSLILRGRPSRFRS